MFIETNRLFKFALRQESHINWSNIALLKERRSIG